MCLSCNRSPDRQRDPACAGLGLVAEPRFRCSSVAEQSGSVRWLRDTGAPSCVPPMVPTLPTPHRSGCKVTMLLRAVPILGGWPTVTELPRGVLPGARTRPTDVTVHVVCFFFS